MNRFSLFAFLLIVGLNNSLFAQDMVKDSSLTILPGNRIYPVIFLDPLECQTHGGAYLLFQDEKDISMYSTVNLGFNKPVVAHTGEYYSWEINFGAAIFSQFEIIRRDDGVYLAGLQNSDFKVSTDFNIKRNNNLLRLRVFHVSSHLGDDFTRRNPEIKNDKSENYEQVDLIYLRLKGTNYWFAGMGEIYTKYVFRKRFSLLAGGLLNFDETKPINLFTSGNVKILAENDYVPDLRIALGVSFNRSSESLIRLWLEYYNGQLPYSTLDYGRVNWAGLGMSINIK